MINQGISHKKKTKAPKKVTIVEPLHHEKDKKIRELEEIIKNMEHEKLEGENIRQILLDDLQKSNEFDVKMLQEKEANPKEGAVEVEEDVNEEFLTDSEEEKINRNQILGRGFLRAKKRRKNALIKTFICPSCEDKFENNQDLINHMKMHQSEAHLLAQSKQQGFRRTGPMSQPSAPSKNQDIDTLCHICKLRCQTRQKLQTHMKNHTGEVETYNLSSLKEAIEKPTSTHPSNEETKDLHKCRKCGKSFCGLDDLKIHLKSAHQSYRPCKNYSDKPEENKCSWNSECGFSHETVEAGTWRCWDCGIIVHSTNNLMIHRKQKHEMPNCKKDGTEKGCDRSEEDCWYPHNKHKKSIQSISTPVISAQNSEEKLDFCQVTNKKAIPITNVSLDSSPKTDSMMMEMMNMIKEQNKTIMEILLTMQNHQMNLMSPIQMANRSQ